MDGSQLPPSYWRETLAPYARPDVRRSVLDLLTSVVPYLALTAAMYALADISVWLVLLLAVPAAGFLVRTFIVFHDCTHGSFLPWRKANAWVGKFCGLLVYSPFDCWRHEHAVHHATAGDLEARGTGDVDTLTLAEYLALLEAPPRLEYRLFRNPLVMLGLGPIWALLIEPRFVPGLGAAPLRAQHHPHRHRARRGHRRAVSRSSGWQAVLLVQLPTAMLAGRGRDLAVLRPAPVRGRLLGARSRTGATPTAALRGARYLKLPEGPPVLHRQHRPAPRAPPERAHPQLQPAARPRREPVFHDVPTLTLWDGIKALRLKLYDEDRGRLIRWSEVRNSPAAQRLAAAPASA